MNNDFDVLMAMATRLRLDGQYRHSGKKSVAATNGSPANQDSAQVTHYHFYSDDEYAEHKFFLELVGRFPEEGFQQVVESTKLPIEQEAALCNLRKWGYLDFKAKNSGHEIEYWIDLRGQLFRDHAAHDDEDV